MWEPSEAISGILGSWDKGPGRQAHFRFHVKNESA